MHGCRYIISNIHALLVTARKIISPKPDSQAFAKLKPKFAKALAAIKIAIVLFLLIVFIIQDSRYNLHHDIWNNTKNMEHSMVSSFFDE